MTTTMGRRTFLATAIGPVALRAGDWPQHLGPARNGFYPDGDFSWNGKPLQVVWKREVGAGFSAPVAEGGRLFAFHRLGDAEVLEAMDAKSGKLIWKTDYATRYRDDFGFDEGPRAAPSVSGGRVFTYGAEGVLTATDGATGKRVWQRAAMKDFGAPKGYFGAACSPVVFDNKVLVGVGGPSGGGVVAFDAATGKTVWQALNDEAGYSSPVVAPFDGIPRAVFFTRTGLAVLDPGTGKITAQMRWRSRSQASVNAATPLVSGNQIFLTASYGTGAALVELTGGQPKVIWSGDESLSCHYATPVLRNGFLFGYHGRQEMGAELRCVEWKTGKVRWAKEGFGAGSILAVMNRLLLVRENGEIVMAEANAGSYQTLATSPAVGGTVRAYPALAHGILYIRNATNLLVALRP